MNAMHFLTEWAVRSSLLIGVAATVLWALRVKDSSIRLAAWIAVLAGSFLIPVMSASLPVVPVQVSQTMPVVATIPTDGHATLVASTQSISQSLVFDWAEAALVFYAVIAIAMLLRLGLGLFGSYRLLQQSSLTEREGVRESERIAAPVTLGIIRPSIVLPSDWRDWDTAKLDAVLAHERSHIERHDPLVQAASAIHRALLWFSPLTWFLHSRIVRTAEEASDDAAVSVTQDRASYAELLLDFVQRGVRVRTTPVAGVPMARYGRADERIHRILDSTILSNGVTKRAIATIFLVGVPLAYVVATAKAQSSAAPATPKQTSGTAFQAKPAPKPLQPKPASAPGDLTGLGVVTASMASVTAEIEGRIDSLDFMEGQLVHAGQVLASVGKQRLQLNLVRAEEAADRDEAQVEILQMRDNPSPGSLRDMQAALSADRETLRQLKREMETTEIEAPITGVAGLRLIDEGNLVHPGQTIVTIAQVQPIAVVFTVPQDELPRLRARMNAGQPSVVEAWTRGEKTKIATGTLAAIDNQIDEKTGAIKLKATFENKDSALFPNQFVNIRLKPR